MWELVDQAWHYFEKVLSPLGMILLAMVVWGEVKAFLTRKRVGVILDAKDKYTKDLTGKLITAVEGYVRLTGIMERIAERGDD